MSRDRNFDNAQRKYDRQSPDDFERDYDEEQRRREAEEEYWDRKYDEERNGD